MAAPVALITLITLISHHSHSLAQVTVGGGPSGTHHTHHTHSLAQVTVGGGPSGTELVVHPPEVKEPLPLTIHHLPMSVTFGLFEVCVGGGEGGGACYCPLTEWGGASLIYS